jgi:predicted Zn-dependent protease
MTPGRARELLQRIAGKGEIARFGWAEGRVAVASSRGLRRAARVTSTWLELICSRAPGAGRAAAASRSLRGLDPENVAARARRRQAPPEVVPPPPAPAPAVLAPEAVAALVELLNRNALTSEAYRSGASFLRGRLGDQILHPALTLRDDPTDPRGLPFPFDLMGSAAAPVDLISQGVARAGAVDDRLAPELGVPTTANLIAPGEAVPTHLFVLPGAADEGQLLAAGEGGVWIAALDPVECFDAHALRFRAVARGVRTIAHGALGLGVPDLICEGSLLEVLGRVRAVGADLVPVATGSGLFRATTTPALAVDSFGTFRVLID